VAVPLSRLQNVNLLVSLKLLIRYFWPRPEIALLHQLKKRRQDQSRCEFLLPDGRKVIGLKGLEAYNEYKDIFIQGIYNFKPCRPNPRIIDGGGYVGFSALYFLGEYPKAQLTVFECDPQVLETLKKNLAIHYDRNIEIVNAALTAKNGEATFYRSGDDAGSLYQATSESFQVQCVSLRPWLEKGEVDFLKLNIEGAEMEVLASCADLLHNIREMVVEFHSFAGQPQRLQELLNTLTTAGFRYLINHFDYESNLAAKPPFKISQEQSYVLLVYAKRFDLMNDGKSCL
jgi:FkbM family methyltransferase